MEFRQQILHQWDLSELGERALVDELEDLQRLQIVPTKEIECMLENLGCLREMLVRELEPLEFVGNQRYELFVVAELQHAGLRRLQPLGRVCAGHRAPSRSASSLLFLETFSLLPVFRTYSISKSTMAGH